MAAAAAAAAAAPRGGSGGGDRGGGGGIIPDPSSEHEWLALGAQIFPDWHAQGLAQYHAAGWTLQALVDYRRKADPAWLAPSADTVAVWALQIAPTSRPRRLSSATMASPFAARRSVAVSAQNLADALKEEEEEDVVMAVEEDVAVAGVASGSDPNPDSAADGANFPPPTTSSDEDDGSGSGGGEGAKAATAATAVSSDGVGTGHRSNSDSLAALRAQRRAAAAAAREGDINADKGEALRRLRKKKAKTRSNAWRAVTERGGDAFLAKPPGVAVSGADKATDQPPPPPGEGWAKPGKARRFIPSQRMAQAPRQRPPVDESTEFWVQVDGRGPRFFSKVYERHVQWARPSGNVVIIQGSMCRRGAQEAAEKAQPPPGWQLEESGADPSLLDQPPGNLKF